MYFPRTFFLVSRLTAICDGAKNSNAMMTRDPLIITGLELELSACARTFCFHSRLSDLRASKGDGVQAWGDNSTLAKNERSEANEKRF